tara:strand:- start:2174 stop:2275 length:102 start_codon:yes stop_codon:yes gene_type:complete
MYAEAEAIVRETAAIILVAIVKAPKSFTIEECL